MQVGSARGAFGVVVWPAYIGVVTSAGVEPEFGWDYNRGQIRWSVCDGEVIGEASVEVPGSVLDYTHVIYTHHPTKMPYWTVQKFSHPFHLPQGGTIRLSRITERDVTPLRPDPVLHD